jgi:hypothetical protein
VFFAIACLRKITHLFIFHRATSEKLQHIKLWKFAVFHTSRGTSSLPSMNKIRDGRVFFIGSRINFTLVRIWSKKKKERSTQLQKKKKNEGNQLNPKQDTKIAILSNAMSCKWQLPTRCTPKTQACQLHIYIRQPQIRVRHETSSFTAKAYVHIWNNRTSPKDKSV